MDVQYLVNLLSSMIIKIIFTYIIVHYSNLLFFVFFCYRALLCFKSSTHYSVLDRVSIGVVIILGILYISWDCFF